MRKTIYRSISVLFEMPIAFTYLWLALLGC